jgi:hypothetical protein
MACCCGADICSDLKNGIYPGSVTVTFGQTNPTPDQIDSGCSQLSAGSHTLSLLSATTGAGNVNMTFLKTLTRTNGTTANMIAYVNMSTIGSCGYTWTTVIPCNNFFPDGTGRYYSIQAPFDPQPRFSASQDGFYQQCVLFLGVLACTTVTFSFNPLP